MRLVHRVRPLLRRNLASLREAAIDDPAPPERIGDRQVVKPHAWRLRPRRAGPHRGHGGRKPASAFGDPCVCRASDVARTGAGGARPSAGASIRTKCSPGGHRRLRARL